MIMLKTSHMEREYKTKDISTKFTTKLAIIPKTMDVSMSLKKETKHDENLSSRQII